MTEFLGGLRSIHLSYGDGCPIIIPVSYTHLATVRGTVRTFASGDQMVHGVLDMAQGFVSLVAHLASPRVSSKCEGCPYKRAKPCVLVPCYKDLKMCIRDRP